MESCHGEVCAGVYPNLTMASPDDILAQYGPEPEAKPKDEHGFLFSNVGGDLKFNPWESVKNFMGYRAPPGALSTSGDDAPIRNSMDTAGWLGISGLGLNWAGAVPANAAGIFGGRLGAKNLADQGIMAPQKAIEMAERMKAAGATKEEIWRETAGLMSREDPRFSGVHYGKDYNPRFEIPDKDASWPERMLDTYERRQEAVTQPGETLEHPLLYAAYPEMRNIPMEGVARSQLPSGGVFDPGLIMPGDLFKAQIAAQGPTPERARQVALHELQHATQFKENHARGSNPEIAPSVMNMSDPGIREAMVDFENVKRALDRKDLDHTTEQRLLDEYFRIGGYLKQAGQTEGYRRSAGETEARNVEKRARMTPEQLRNRPPWETQDVPDAQQILEMYGAPPARADGGSVEPDHAAMSDMGSSMQYAPLNLENLLRAGAVRVTHPGDGKGGYEQSTDPDAYSIVSHYNDQHSNGMTQQWPDKPESYSAAADAINKPGPLYDGKYQQILWSAQQKGLPESEIFLNARASGGRVRKI